VPHVIVKLYPGRSEEQKAKLAEEITRALIEVANSSEKSISVGIEEVAPEDWTETVEKPDILGKWDRLYKKPGPTPG
jgi:4-oxalocrotonate tautomerase